MTSITVIPGRRSGAVSVPVSKSHLHRLLIADFLAGGKLYEKEVAAGEDVKATRKCLAALEAAGNDTVPELDCCESGSTLRFMLPVAMTCGDKVLFHAAGRLPQRPIQPFLELLAAHGVSRRPDEKLFPLCLEGRLMPGKYSLRGDVSSQIITGLLFALPLLDEDSRIECTTPLQSRGYVDMTLQVLEQFGIHTDVNGDDFFIPGRQKYAAFCCVEPELDWSGAAFWLAMNELGSDIAVPGMDQASRQPDSAITELLKLSCGTIDVSQCPDIFPVLAAVAAAKDAVTCFTGIERLRMKESDRLAAMEDVLSRFGVHADNGEKEFIVNGAGSPVRGGCEICTYNDHRIAMSAAVLASVADGPVVIQDPECTAKSYPDFFMQLEALEIKQ